jgi:hypothetical protein
MSSLSSLSNWQPAMRYAAATSGRNANPIVAKLDAAASLPPSTIVTLSPEGIAAASAPIPASQRYKDLGADMLKQFEGGAVIPPDHARLPPSLDNRFTLNITTHSGVKVDLTLANVDNEMIYQVSASDELNEDERKALSALADGFQAAIDGMAAAAPQVKLSSLAQFDSKFVQSIDFHAQVAGADATTQSLDFHIDETVRKVRIGGPDGQAEVNVDTSAFEHVGNKQQQAKAINNYLAQFDQALTRGHGDKKLMAMFKDAFSDMNRTATSEERADAPASSSRWKLSADDHPTLTGLSDFSASLTQTPKSSNPLKPQQEDTFSYNVSQSTKIDGLTRDERSIAQSQQSHLGAEYHTALGKSGPPIFDGTPQTQNYEYHRIDDNAGSNVSLNYRNGKLAKASLAQAASQSEQVFTFILGKLKLEKTTPVQQSLVRDLLPSLTSFDHLKGEDSVNDNIFLLGSPGEIVARGQEFQR